MAKKKVSANSRKQNSVTTDSSTSDNAAAVTEEVAEPIPLKPIPSQPVAFWVALTCLIGWLFFLAYVSFVVSV